MFFHSIHKHWKIIHKSKKYIWKKIINDECLYFPWKEKANKTKRIFGVIYTITKQALHFIMKNNNEVMCESNKLQSNAILLYFCDCSS